MKANRRRRILKTRHTLRAMVALAAAMAAAPAGAQQAPPPEALTLKQAVALALRDNSEVSLAQLRYQSSQRALHVTRSLFQPNLYVGSGAAYTSGFPLLAGGGAPAVMSLSYDQELFNPLARSDARVAGERSAQLRLAIDAARDAVAVRVASSYLELAKTRRELDLMRRERDSAQKILEFTQQRVEAGFELPIEETKAQLTAARVAQRIAQLEDADDTLSDQMRSLMNLAPEQRIEVVAEDMPAVADQAVGEWVARALQNNTEIKQADSERVASEEHLRGERGSRWPTIGIIGQYNILAQFNNYNQFFSKFQRNNVIAGIDVRVPIFASRTSSAVALAQADLTVAQRTVQNKRTEVTLEVRQKARQAHERTLGGEVSRLELELAQANLQVVQTQFAQGRASVRDVEAAQLDENDKWLAFLDADFARQQAQLELLRTTGQVAALLQ